jgi:hypothetical protein
VKALLYYSKEILKYNLIASFFATSLMAVFPLVFEEQPPVEFVLHTTHTFCGIFLSAGFVLAVGIYHYYRRNEYPLYYNMGFQIWQCIISAYLIYLSVISFIYLILFFVGI